MSDNKQPVCAGNQIPGENELFLSQKKKGVISGEKVGCDNKGVPTIIFIKKQ